MAKHKYPVGAIKTLAELKPLLTRAKAGETVKVYTIKGNGKHTRIEDAIIVELLISSLGRHSLQIIHSGLPLSFMLEYRNIPTWMEEEPVADKWFLFSNYWLAFAEQCRRQAQVKEEIDGK